MNHSDSAALPCAVYIDHSLPGRLSHKTRKDTGEYTRATRPWHVWTQWNQGFIGQGFLNVANGLTDNGVSNANSLTHTGFTGVAVQATESITGTDLNIPALDWSRDRVTHESDFLHDTSKFVGAESVMGLSTLGLGQLNLIARAQTGLRASGFWRLRPFERGRRIEQLLGHNLPSNFPTIDRFRGGIAASIKSLDLAAASYSNPATVTRVVRGYINKVAAFRGRNWGGVNIRPADITGRVLDCAVPPGATTSQLQALQGLVRYGVQNGVTVNIVVVP